MYARIFAMAIMLIDVSVAEIIDRIAVTVEDTVITESEIIRQIRIAAFVSGEKPDLSPSNKRDMADKLIDQALIRREVKANMYAFKAPEGTGERYDEIRSRYASEAEFRKALDEYGITEHDVKEALAWQNTFLEFIEVRFRPGIQIPEQELREYYEDKVTAAAADRAPKPAFEEARGDIEKILTQMRIDNALDRWLGQSRTQSRIVYRQEVFR